MKPAPPIMPINQIDGIHHGPGGLCLTAAATVIAKVRPIRPKPAAIHSQE